MESTQHDLSGEGVALIGATWLSLREADPTAARLSRDLADELAAAGRPGVFAVAAAAVAILDALRDLHGIEAVHEVLELAGRPADAGRPTADPAGLAEAIRQKVEETTSGDAGDEPGPED